MEGRPKVYIAADHAGFALKSELIPAMFALGYAVEDVGAFIFDPSDDYPDYVIPLAKKVALEPNSFGVITAGSGRGEAMAANREDNVRAAVFYGQRRVVGALDIEGAASQD